MRTLFTLLLFIFIGQYTLTSQCSPVAALTCEEVPILCSLNELDGFTCTTSSMSNPTGPDPLCNGLGTPTNTQWWAFRGNGNVMTLTFNTDMSSCSLNKGIAAGISSQCGYYIPDCNADCTFSNFSLSFDSYRCHTYYLWVDGCEGDICDFDIQVTNGEPRHLPSPLEPMLVFGDVRPGCDINVLQPDMEGFCWEANYTWTIDGVVFSHRELSTRLQVPSPAHPFEICLELTVGKGSIICDQATNCIIIDPDPIQVIDEGELYICWEEHRGVGYLWQDTLIYSSCINPPCKVIRGNDDCFQEYSIILHILEERTVKDVYRFICDKSELPLITEGGSIWDVETCDEEIKWIDNDYYFCDTSYNLYLEIFDPEVSLSSSCPNCNDSIELKAEITYNPECSTEDTYWTVFWLNEALDTIGIGDSIIINKEGKYEAHLFVNHINNLSGIVQTCFVHDTSWYINIQFDSLSISGDSLICDVDTSEFTLPNSYANSCEILWTIEGVNGQIITPDPENKTTIEVFWPDNNTSNGELCAEIVDACDSTKKVCKTLEGCFVTNKKDIDNIQWMIYPNPARDILYIEGVQLDEMNIKIHNIKGNEIIVLPKRALGGGFSIDVENLASGIYFILIIGVEESSVLKVLIL